MPGYSHSRLHSSRTGGPVARGKCRSWRLPHRLDSSGRSPTISTWIRAALASPAFSCLPRSSAKVAFYLGANFDGSGQPLRGENTYRLHVPANVPVSQFWSVTVYNSDTAALFLNLTRPTLDSLDKGMLKHDDGSLDIYFGPKAPAGLESNWIYTPAEKSWFPWFRFYGPEKPLFDKSWKMPDIEMVKQ